MALRSPACSAPTKSQFFFPMAVGLIEFSTRLLSTSILPSARKISSPLQLTQGVVHGLPKEALGKVTTACF